MQARLERGTGPRTDFLSQSIIFWSCRSQLFRETQDSMLPLALFAGSKIMSSADWTLWRSSGCQNTTSHRNEANAGNRAEDPLPHCGSPTGQQGCCLLQANAISPFGQKSKGSADTRAPVRPPPHLSQRGRWSPSRRSAAKWTRSPGRRGGGGVSGRNTSQLTQGGSREKGRWNLNPGTRFLQLLG